MKSHLYRVTCCLWAALWLGLFLTLMAGPLGLGLYLGVRFVQCRELSLEEAAA